MTEQEQNMVNRLKMAIARVIIDFDDEKLLEIIKKAAEKSENENQR